MHEFRNLTLTEQELQTAYLARHDLGPGYPQLEVPSYVHRLYLDTTSDDLSLRFPPFWSPDKQASIDADLEFAVKQFLRISETLDVNVRATFSGSVALDRTLNAVRLLAIRRKKRELIVITTTPSIDMMRLVLQERADVHPVFVESNKNDQFGQLDLDRIIDIMLNLHSENQSADVALILCSPENPTGSIWQEANLITMARECKTIDATLILDHAFAFAGIHSPSSVARIWDLPIDLCRWIGIWDTGKTFGLSEDKLGFIICADPEMQPAIEASVAVLQFGIARRAKLFFSELLRKAILYDHVGELRALCSANYQYLRASVESNRKLSLKVNPIDAGSLALIDISATGQTDESIRDRLLRQGIGVIAGNVFFHTQWKPEIYIRLALARRGDYFQEAVDRLLGLL